MSGECPEEDVKLKLAEFEAKYGMTSEEFSRRWNQGELDCGVRDFIAWVGYCHAASKNDVDGLKIAEAQHWTH